MTAMRRLFNLVIFAIGYRYVESHKLGLHAVIGEPSTTMHIRDLHGPFEISVVARFDDVEGGYYQRIFDFGNGAPKDNVFLSQYKSSNDLFFGVYTQRRKWKLKVEGVIVEGETATWTVGVDTNGTGYIEKNGVRLAEEPGNIPKNLRRSSQLLGSSNWKHFNGKRSKDTRLVGAILGLKMQRFGVTADWLKPYEQTDLWNKRSQAWGPFAAGVYARFDDVSSSRSGQKVFDFSNSDATNGVSFGQQGSTRDMALEVYQDGITYVVVAEDSIVEGEMALWDMGVDHDGTMWIEKNGSRLAEEPGVVPQRLFRKIMLFGQSPRAGNDPLDGAVLGFMLDLQDNS